MLVNIVFRWLIVIIWAFVIFFLSSQPTLPIPSGIIGEIISKSSHFFVFFILCLALFNALKAHQKIKKPLLGAVLISLIYAALDEFHQSFVPGRDSDILDFLTDGVGIITLALILLLKQQL